jgi:N6-adenosine-specific RNA methylase IME4
VVYKTIVADPPWRYRSKDITTRGWHKTASVESGKNPMHYTTMTNAEIAALPVGELADEQAELYLWVTNPRLYGERDGAWSPRQIIEEWGFTYITLLTWVKTPAPAAIEELRPPRNGLGFYYRVGTEHVLYCVRGGVRIPPPLRESNVLIAPRRGHSQKPDVFYDVVERVSQTPRLEMFARQQRLGWDTWGDEALQHVKLGEDAA